MKRREYPVSGPPAFRTHPGAILRDTVLPALRVTVIQAAEELGVSRQTLHRILAETHPVTPDTAVRLGKWCGNGSGFWLRLQAEYDLHEAERRLEKQVKRIPTRHEAA